MPLASRRNPWQFSYRRGVATRQHVAAFALSALLLLLVFPRPGWSWVAYLALVPAGMAAARSRTPRMLGWTAAVVFAVWWAWMLRWMWPVSLPGALILSVWLGINAAFALLLAMTLNQRGRVPMTLALPLAWVSVEAIRSVFPVGGLAWFSLAQSQSAWAEGEAGRVVQVADLFGQHTVGLVVAMVNGLWVDLMVRRPKQRRRMATLTAAVLIAANVYGAWRLAQFDHMTEPGPALAVVQTNVPQDNKEMPTPESMRADWAELIDLHRIAAAPPADSGDASGVDLIVWPETVIPAPLNTAGALAMRSVGEDTTALPEVQAMYQMRARFSQVVPELIARSATPTLVGAATIAFDPYRRYNSVYYFNAEGGPMGVYHKTHLVPFGEYIPGPGFIERFVAWISPWQEGYSLSAGRELDSFTLPGGASVGTPICFEDAVAGVCRDMVYGDSGKRLDLLVNHTNDGWFAGIGQRHQHTQLAALRCIENRVPMARSVNTGVSGFIDSVGRPGPLVRAEQDGDVVPAYRQPGVARATVRLDSRTTLYGEVGGWPMGLLVAATLLGALASAVFGRSTRRGG